MEKIRESGGRKKAKEQKRIKNGRARKTLPRKKEWNPPDFLSLVSALEKAVQPIPPPFQRAPKAPFRSRCCTYLLRRKPQNRAFRCGGSRARGKSFA